MIREGCRKKKPLKKGTNHNLNHNHFAGADEPRGCGDRTLPKPDRVSGQVGRSRRWHHLVLIMVIQ